MNFFPAPLPRPGLAILATAGFLFSPSITPAHWDLDEEYWTQRTQPEPIPANLKPSQPMPAHLAKDGPIYYTTGVRVLGYHDVFVEPNVSPTSDVVPDMFREHMAFLKRANYNVVTMDQVNAHITSGTPVPPNAVAITFDDVYRGQYWEAYPILEEFGYKATFYVHTNFVGVLTGKDHSTWAELAEKVGKGHDVQSHTLTHPNLANLGQPQLDNELFNSRLAIINNLGIVVDQICYPFGAFNTTVISRAQAAGYSYGQTTIGGLNIPGTLPFETRRNLLGVGDTLTTFRNLMGYTGTDDDAPVIIDNTDTRFSAGGYSSTGSTSTHRGQHGTNYHRAAATTGSPSATAVWTFTPTRTGRYSLAAWWPGAANSGIGQNTGATYRMSYAGVTSQVLLNQTPGTKARWNPLGRVVVAAGQPMTVNLNNQVASGTDVYADAVRFELLPGPALFVRGTDTSQILPGALPSSANGTDFGQRDVHLGSVTRTLTLSNLGSDALNLTAPPSIEGGNGEFHLAPVSAGLLPSGQSIPLTVTFDPATSGSKTASIMLRTDDPETPEFSISLQATATGFSLVDPIQAASAWEPLASTVPGFTSNFHDSSAAALLSSVVADPQQRIRVAGWRTNSSGNIPIRDVSTGQHLRARFSIYATGQTSATDHSQVPNFRLRLAQRFAISAFQDINHYSAADPEGNRLGAEIRPSSDATRPSIYRVDFDPIRVPLYESQPDEQIQRTFEVLALDPTQQGSLALTEASVGAVTTAPDASGTRIKDYTTTGGDFVRAFVARLAYLTSPIPAPGFPPALAGDVQGITFSNGGVGVPLTLDTSQAPSNRFNIIAADLTVGNAADTDLRQRARIEQGYEYRIRFLVGANVPAERNAQIRLRARTAKFVWSHRLEIGGAWAIGTDPNTGNAAIAQQALPGIGTRNPNRHPILTNAAWYTLLFPNPLREDIRPEFSTGVPVAARMPILAGMDGPGVDTGEGTLSKSRRDILMGIDVIDTLSPGPRASEETGQAILSAIEVNRFPQISD